VFTTQPGSAAGSKSSLKLPPGVQGGGVAVGSGVGVGVGAGVGEAEGEGDGVAEGEGVTVGAGVGVDAPPGAHELGRRMLVTAMSSR
jgi:hypothetical protein